MNRQEEVQRILRDCCALLADTHVVYVSGKHGSRYVNKDAVLKHPWAAWHICRMMAELLIESGFCGRDGGIQVVAAPVQAGAIMGQMVAFFLSELGGGGEVLSIYADKEGKDPEGKDIFVVKRGFDTDVKGKRVLLVEDVLTTGGSLAKVFEVVRAIGGDVAAAIALFNRGGVMPEKIGVPALYSLVDATLEDYLPGACPLCQAGKEINTSVGKGKKFLDENPDMRHLAPAGYVPPTA